MEPTVAAGPRPRPVGSPSAPTRSALSCGVLSLVRVVDGRQAETAAGDVVEGRVEIDAEVAAVELEGGQAGGAGAAERVKDETAGWAAGGDAPQRDVDGERGEVG